MSRNAPDIETLAGIVAFLNAAEPLKDTLRSGFTGKGRSESTADHTWRLCLLALVCAPHIEGIDPLRLIKLCLVHDLGEAVCGDVPAIHQTGDPSRATRERGGVAEICKTLPKEQREEFLALYDEYDAGQSREARIAKGLDKLETIAQHNRGKNPSDFDYAFNLDYGRVWTDGDPVLVALRELLDVQTRAHMAAQTDA